MKPWQGALMCAAVRQSDSMGDVGQTELEADVRRVVDVLGVLGDTESKEPTILDPVAQAESDQVLLAGQLIEISRLVGVYAATDIGLQVEVGPGRHLVFVTKNKRGNNLRLLRHRRPRAGVVDRGRIHIEGVALPQSLQRRLQPIVRATCREEEPVSGDRYL